jgi:hypothetical protein
MALFIKVKVRSHVVFHGYDSSNKEIEEKIDQKEWVVKLVAVERILSVSEKFLLTSYGAGRLIYWEYEGGIKKISAQLKKAKALI